MSYYQLQTLTGGTYTAGTNWATQFNGADISGLCTVTGEIHVGAVTCGVMASTGIQVANPTTLRFYVEADATHPVQMHYADQRVEITSAGYQTIEFLAGISALRFVREVGPLIVMGLIFGPSFMPKSLYGLKGADPIENVVTGITSEHTGSGALFVPPAIPH